MGCGYVLGCRVVPGSRDVLYVRPGVSGRTLGTSRQRTLRCFAAVVSAPCSSALLDRKHADVHPKRHALAGAAGVAVSSRTSHFKVLMTGKKPPKKPGEDSDSDTEAQGSDVPQNMSGPSIDEASKKSQKAVDKFALAVGGVGVGAGRDRGTGSQGGSSKIALKNRLAEAKAKVTLPSFSASCCTHNLAASKLQQVHILECQPLRQGQSTIFLIARG